MATAPLSSHDAKSHFSEWNNSQRHPNLSSLARTTLQILTTATAVWNERSERNDFSSLSSAIEFFALLCFACVDFILQRITNDFMTDDYFTTNDTNEQTKKRDMKIAKKERKTATKTITIRRQRWTRNMTVTVTATVTQRQSHISDWILWAAMTFEFDFWKRSGMEWTMMDLSGNEMKLNERTLDANQLNHPRHATAMPWKMMRGSKK